MYNSSFNNNRKWYKNKRKMVKLMNKKLLLLLLFGLLSINFDISSEEINLNQKIIPEKLIIIPSHSVWSWYPYQLEDGQNLSIFKTINLIDDIDINKNLAIKAKVTNIVALVSGIISISSFVAYPILYSIDNIDSVYMTRVIPITFGISFLTTLLTGQMRDKYIERGVFNYNSYK